MSPPGDVHVWAAGLLMLTAGLMLVLVAAALFVWTRTLGATANNQLVNKERQAFCLSLSAFSLIMPLLLLLSTGLFLALSLIDHWQSLQRSLATGSITMLCIRGFFSFLAQTSGELCLLWKLRVVFANISSIRHRAITITIILILLRMIVQVLQLEALASLTTLRRQLLQSNTIHSQSTDLRRQLQRTTLLTTVFNILAMMNVVFMSSCFVYHSFCSVEAYRQLAYTSLPIYDPIQQHHTTTTNTRSENPLSFTTATSFVIQPLPSKCTTSLMIMAQHTILPALFAIILCLYHPVDMNISSTINYNVDLYLLWNYQSMFAVSVTYSVHILYSTCFNSVTYSDDDYTHHQNLIIGSGVLYIPLNKFSNTPLTILPTTLTSIHYPLSTTMSTNNSLFPYSYTFANLRISESLTANLLFQSLIHTLVFPLASLMPLLPFNSVMTDNNISSTTNLSSNTQSFRSTDNLIYRRSRFSTISTFDNVDNTTSTSSTFDIRHDKLGTDIEKLLPLPSPHLVFHSIILLLIYKVKSKLSYLAILLGWKNGSFQQISSPSLSPQHISPNVQSLHQSPVITNNDNDISIPDWSVEPSTSSNVVTKHNPINNLKYQIALGSPIIISPNNSTYYFKHRHALAIYYWIMHACKNKPMIPTEVLTLSNNFDSLFQDWQTALLGLQSRLSFEGTSNVYNFSTIPLPKSLLGLTISPSSKSFFNDSSSGYSPIHNTTALSQHLKLLLRNIFKQVKEAVCIPLHCPGMLAGAIYLESRRSSFKDDLYSLDLLLNICKHFGICNVNTRLFKQLEDLNDDFEKRVLDRTAQLEMVTRKAEETAKAKTMFLVNMSHEIRTPAAQVIQAANLLAETKLTDEQYDHIHVIRSAGEQLLALLNDVLDFSKLEHGKIRFEHRPFDLFDAIYSSIDTFIVSGSQIDLAYYIDKRLPRLVMGDVTRVRQIFNNLLSNALKFTHTGSVILRCTVVDCLGLMLNPDFVPTTYSSNGNMACSGLGPRAEQMVAYDVTFSVTDTGVGIPPEKLSVIFERFEQSDVSITRRFGGTGLGLSICLSLCQLMHCKIHVTSQVNRGSCFYFTLRLYSPNETSQSPAIIPRTLSTITERDFLLKKHVVLLCPTYENITDDSSAYNDNTIVALQLEGYFCSLRTVSYYPQTIVQQQQRTLVDLQTYLHDGDIIDLFVILSPIWIPPPSSTPSTSLLESTFTATSTLTNSAPDQAKATVHTPVLIISRSTASIPSSYYCNNYEYLRRPYKQSHLLRLLCKLLHISDVDPQVSSKSMRNACPCKQGPENTLSVTLPMSPPTSPALSCLSSTFSLISPSIAAPASLPVYPISRTPLSNSDIKILVVDDNPINRRMMRQTMRILGCDADFAENGLESVDKAKKNNYDIIFMDVRMPILNGLEATRLIREHFGQSSTSSSTVNVNYCNDNFFQMMTNRPGPLICGLSADAMDENERSALAAGMDTYIRKPLLKNDAAKILERVKSMKRLLSQ